MMGALTNTFGASRAIMGTTLQEEADFNRDDVFNFPNEMELSANETTCPNGDVPTHTINDPHLLRLVAELKFFYMLVMSLIG